MIEKEYKELYEIVHMPSISYDEGTYKFGGRLINDQWRVIFHSINLEYDILFPGVFNTEQECTDHAKGFANALLKKKKL